MFLQSYIVPVCRFVYDGDKALAVKAYGTAFLIGSEGHFLTAAHVVGEERAGDGGFVGLMCKATDGSPASVAVKIEEHVVAEAPFDVALGVTSHTCGSPFTLKHREVTIWSQVAAAGYPESTIIRQGRGLFLALRGKRGYVQRIAESFEASVGDQPRHFETNFPVEPGMSGAPLFIHAGASDHVVGICTGVNKSRQVEYEYEEVEEDGTVFRERRYRVEEFGIAQDLAGLSDWRPHLLGGRKLSEVA
jgi:hypothetical protein